MSLIMEVKNSKMAKDTFMVKFSFLQAEIYSFFSCSDTLAGEK